MPPNFGHMTLSTCEAGVACPGGTLLRFLATMRASLAIYVIDVWVIGDCKQSILRHSFVRGMRRH